MRLSAFLEGRQPARLAAFLVATGIGWWAAAADAQPYHRDSVAIVLEATDVDHAPDRIATVLCGRLDALTLRHHAVAITDDDRVIALVPAALTAMADPDPLTDLGHVGLHAVLDVATGDLEPDDTSLILAGQGPDAAMAYRLAPEAIVDRSHLRDVELALDFGAPAITLRLNNEGARRFADHTGANIGQAVAVVMDGRVLSAPVVRERIAGGQVLISGRFDHDEVSIWAAVLSAEPLDAPLERGRFFTLDGLKAALVRGDIGIAVTDFCTVP